MPAAIKPFRILALSGGGYLGLYAASVLAALESHVAQPIGQRFDLVAGTSVGGILAAAVAMERPMADVVRFFREKGAEVFSPRAKPSGAVTRLLDLSRSVLGPKYSGLPLRRALEAELGTDTRIDQLLHPLLLTAVDVRRSLTKVFKTPHADASIGDESVKLVDAVLAGCAAPAYFPAIEVGDGLYADGGLFAVAPDQVALHEAEHFMGVDPSRVHLLSIGTATRGYRPVDGIEADAGAVGWLSDSRLVMTLIAVGQQHVQAMMEDRLGRRYLRLDAEWPAEAGLGLDVATPEAAKTLQQLADRTVRGLDWSELAALF